MVDDVDGYVRRFTSEDAEVSTSLKKVGVEIGKLRKGELAKRVFTDLNLSKKSDVATRVKEYVANSVFGQKCPIRRRPARVRVTRLATC